MEHAEVGTVLDGMAVKWVIELGPKDSLTPEQQKLILNWRGAVHFVGGVGEALTMAGVE